MSTPTPPEPASPRSPGPHPSIKRLLIIAVLLGLFAAAMWFAWLSWDHTYYYVDGVARGPYRAWQVIGCVLSIGTAAVLGYRRAPRALAIAVLAIAADAGFAVPWGVDASAGDTSGLWAVGLFLLVIIGCVALSSVLVITHMLHKPDNSPSQALVVCTVLTLLAVVVYAPVAIVPLAGGGWVFFVRWLPNRQRPQNGQAHQA